MADVKQLSTTGAIAFAAALAGAGAHAQFAPALPTEAHPVQMRWLDEGPGRPNRYAIAIATKVGAANGVREIVCEADGSAPKLNGINVADSSDAVDLCKATAAYSHTAASDITNLTSLLSK